jgi:hypothetical protein
MISNGYFESACSYIGEIHEVFPGIQNYSEIVYDI